MKYRMVAAALAVSISAFTGAACSDDDDPGGPSGLPTTFVFTSTLTAANEVPPVTGPEGNATGTLNLTMNVTRDGNGSITAATGTFVVNMTGFPVNTPIVSAHIHPGAAGQNNGFIVNLGLGNGEVVLANGAGTFTKSTIPITVANAEAIIANPGAFYFNVHTTLNPGGAIRGQLVLQ
jgi:hypothetical protein